MVPELTTSVGTATRKVTALHRPKHLTPIFPGGPETRRLYGITVCAGSRALDPQRPSIRVPCSHNDLCIFLIVRQCPTRLIMAPGSTRTELSACCLLPTTEYLRFLSQWIPCSAHTNRGRLAIPAAGERWRPQT